MLKKDVIHYEENSGKYFSYNYLTFSFKNESYTCIMKIPGAKQLIKLPTY